LCPPLDLGLGCVSKHVGWLPWPSCIKIMVSYLRQPRVLVPALALCFRMRVQHGDREDS
jgi:hypothetical protein